jgi:hypothetical protein
MISTHELSLIEQSPSAQVVVLNGCDWASGSPSGFEIDLLGPEEAFSSDVRAAILGGRRQILFVEGDADSLDNRLYSLLFPSVTVICREGYRNVIDGVKGLRGAQQLHWVEAWGVIDRDNRSPSEVTEMQAEGIFPLSLLQTQEPELELKISRKVSGAVSDCSSSSCLAALLWSSLRVC